MNARYAIKIMLVFTLATICTNGYAQSNSTNAQIIIPKDSTANPDQPIIDDDNTIYTSVKIMPDFPGGEAAMKKYFADKMQSWESKKNIWGKVFVQVVIGKDGTVEPENVKITSSLDAEINEKVIGWVKSMPKWSPGMRYESKSGKVTKVLARVSMNIPVELSIKGEEQEEVFFIVEHMPEFPGGDIALREYIKENTVYPEEAKAKGLSGKVFVQFVVNKEGDVVNPQIARGVDPILDKEAIRVIQSLPKWKPGEQSKRIDGEKVWIPQNVSYTVPIDFQMD